MKNQFGRQQPYRGPDETDRAAQNEGATPSVNRRDPLHDQGSRREPQADADLVHRRAHRKFARRCRGWNARPGAPGSWR